MKNSVTQADIDSLIAKSQIKVQTVFSKCTIVSVQLPNGFVIVESSSCVDPINYSEVVGTSICIDRIKNKLWELEGYKLQNELGGNNMSMKLGIEGGSMEITDDNQTIVSADIAKEIQDNTIKPDDKKDWEAPVMQIKDSL